MGTFKGIQEIIREYVLNSVHLEHIKKNIKKAVWFTWKKILIPFIHLNVVPKLEYALLISDYGNQLMILWPPPGPGETYMDRDSNCNSVINNTEIFLKIKE